MKFSYSTLAVTLALSSLGCQTNGKEVQTVLSRLVAFFEGQTPQRPKAKRSKREKKPQPPFASIDYTPFVTRGNELLSTERGPRVDPVAITAKFKIWIEKRDFKAAEAFLRQSRSQDHFDADGSSTYSRVVYALSDAISARDLLALDAWCKSTPASMYAWLAVGIAHKQAAWDARGTKFSKDVKKSAWDTFDRELGSAAYAFHHARKVDMTDPYPLVFLIDIGGKGLDSPKKLLREYLLEVLKLDPVNLPVHRQAWSALLPIWIGSMDELFAFSRAVATAYPQSRLPLLLIGAHERAPREYDGKDNERLARYFQRPEVWKEVTSILQRMAREYPESAEPHHYLGRIAMHANRHDLARSELQMTLGKPCVSCGWDSPEYYEEVLKYYELSSRKDPSADRSRK